MISFSMSVAVTVFLPLLLPLFITVPVSISLSVALGGSRSVTFSVPVSASGTVVVSIPLPWAVWLVISLLFLGAHTFPLPPSLSLSVHVSDPFIVPTAVLGAGPEGGRCKEDAEYCDNSKRYIKRYKDWVSGYVCMCGCSMLYLKGGE